MKKFFSVLFIVIIVIGTFSSCSTEKKDDSSVALKTVFLTVVHQDGTKKEYTAKSDAKYLGKAFADQKLYSGEKGEYGLYIKTVDGVTVNEEKEEWWCLTKGGEMVNTGIDLTPFEDNDKFELTFTTGY